MQISITNGTLTSIQETLSSNSGYDLPSSIVVTGATSSYSSSTGIVSLTVPTSSMSLTATGTVHINPYLTFSSPSTFTLAVPNSTKNWDGTLEYSTDTTTWDTWDGTTTLNSSSSGTTKYLYVRGSNNSIITGTNDTNKRWVLIGSNISIAGYISKLLDYQNTPNPASGVFRYLFCGDSNYTTNTGIINCSQLVLDVGGVDKAYYDMFGYCSGLVYAPVLPATTLATECYEYMFKNCTSLTTAPTLPATTLAYYCYEGMFWGCTSLTAAPELLATTLTPDCYAQMFRDCTSLTTVPALPATTLATYCYEHMFTGCTSLTSAPALPATTLAYHCYEYMFSDCTSLTTAPALPATTLVLYCYQYMFSGCTALTTAPTLSATTLADYCCCYMFKGCTSLITAPTLPATRLAERCYNNMFWGCTSLTAAPALPATIPSSFCYAGMFKGCTSLITAPTLPATALASNCYNSMFAGCTSLTSAPALPATTLAIYCYEYMFSDCTSLITPPTLSATTLATGCYISMFENCTSLSTTPELPATTLAKYCYEDMFRNCTSLTTPAIMAGGTTQATPAPQCCYMMYAGCTALNIYTVSSGHTAFYKSLTYSTTSSDTNYRSTYQMFYNCKINGATSTADYLTAGTQYYYGASVATLADGRLFIKQNNTLIPVALFEYHEITDLTGTSWVIDSLTCTAGYGQFDVTGTVLDEHGETPTDQNLNFMDVGYGGFNFDAPAGPIEQANAVLYSTFPATLGVGWTISITGGTDVTNTNLINWLQDHAQPMGGNVGLTIRKISITI